MLADIKSGRRRETKVTSLVDFDEPIYLKVPNGGAVARPSDQVERALVLHKRVRIDLVFNRLGRSFRLIGQDEGMVVLDRNQDLIDELGLVSIIAPAEGGNVNRASGFSIYAIASSLNAERIFRNARWAASQKTVPVSESR